MTAAESIAADAAAVLTAGEFSLAVTLRRRGEPTRTFQAVVAELDDGTESLDADGRRLAHAKRLTAPAAADVRDGDVLEVGGAVYAAVGLPTPDLISQTVGFTATYQGRATTGDLKR